jgi:REP element-mobilizing transposase RayT
MARLARELLPDGIFHVTARAVYEFPLFIDDADRHGFVHLLRRLENRHGIHCRAYCLMVSHYHLLLEGRSADLRVLMQRLNGRYAQRFNLRHHRHGHVFGDRYTARSVTSERQLDETCNYIAANPEKSGLLDAGGEWPWLWFDDGRPDAAEGPGTG